MKNILRTMGSDRVRMLAQWLTLLFHDGLRLAFGLPSMDLHTIAPKPVRIPEPILDDIFLPPYRGPYDHDDYRPIMAIAATLQPRTVLELGTAYGNLTANLCRQCPEAQVYTVNAPTETQTGNLVSLGLEPDEIGRVYRAHGFQDRVVQILANTLDLDLTSYLDTESVDLAIIDACHDTGYVMSDFHKVSPLLRPGGVVLLHDTHPSMRGHLLGSYRACMILRLKGYDLRHISGTWWGAWIRPNDCASLS